MNRLKQFLLSFGVTLTLHAQVGMEVPVTLSGGATVSRRACEQQDCAARLDGGFRAVLYPTIKFSEHWFGFAAIQVQSEPYFFEQLYERERELHANLLQGFVGYARVAEGRSLTVRAGQLSTAFGSYLLRYDDKVNPLIDMPLGYGYYYSPVTTNGLTGVQMDVSMKRMDARVQLTNSSPMNQRHVWDGDQYPVWTGGAGITIRQGFRVGASAFRGPYLDRNHPYFFPGEKPPKSLPGTGIGADVQWGRGRWNVNGELQRFHFAYTVFPTVRATIGYGEVRYTIHPRWYVAFRQGLLRTNTDSYPARTTEEAVVGFRAARNQLFKLGYLAVQGPGLQEHHDNVLALQYVVSIDSLTRLRH